MDETVSDNRQIPNEVEQSDSELEIEMERPLKADPELSNGTELAWPNFEARILKSTVSSVTLEWTPLESALVYSIEKYHKRRSWQQVEWTSSSPVEVTDLEENFVYRLRIKALRIAEDGGSYVAMSMSPDVIVNISEYNYL